MTIPLPIFFLWCLASSASALGMNAAGRAGCLSERELNRRLDEFETEIAERYLDLPGVCNGRLTLTSGTAVTTSDVTSATTIYFTPHQGAKISLYDGVTWKLFNFSEISLAVGTLTSDRNYDVFLYNNSGSLALEFSAAWNADGVTRIDAISLQDGVYVKTGATTRRYLGTIHTSAATTTEDSRARRYVWNVCGQVRRVLNGNIPLTTWSYASATSWRPSAGDTTDGQGRVSFVIGLAQTIVAKSHGLSDASANLTPVTSIAIDSIAMETTSVRGQPAAASTRAYGDSHYFGTLTAGYHYVQSINVAVGGGASAMLFYGSGAGANFHTISAEIQG